MKERPILFQPPLVVEILGGRKTQTRRVVKDPTLARLNYGMPQRFMLVPDCPYGVVGDRLWVRETWSVSGKKFRPGGRVVYKADGSEALPDDTGKKRWIPSIFMPRDACRLLLEIIEIRVERLQDIDDNDAEQEGVSQYLWGMGFSPIEEFKELWVHINGPQSWIDNPWVWVVTFKKIER